MLNKRKIVTSYVATNANRSKYTLFCCLISKSNNCAFNIQCLSIEDIGVVFLLKILQTQYTHEAPSSLLREGILISFLNPEFSGLLLFTHHQTFHGVPSSNPALSSQLCRTLDMQKNLLLIILATQWAFQLLKGNDLGQLIEKYAITESTGELNTQIFEDDIATWICYHLNIQLKLTLQI